MKKCKCGETDPAAFYPSQKNANTCKACIRKKSAAWVVANPDGAKVNYQRSLARSLARRRAATRLRQDAAAVEAAEERSNVLCSCMGKNGRCLRDGRDPKKEAYASRAWKTARAALLISQGGRCAACGTDSPGQDSTGRVGWHLDHNHATGVLRSVLCMKCNTGIGLAGESQERLARWSLYLQRHIDEPGDVLELPSNQRSRRRT